jgi:hypothetical protein
MARQVDREFWRQYFETYNAKRFNDLVNNFYSEHPIFQNPKHKLVGRSAIADFFTQQHTYVDASITPLTVILTPEVAAFEMDAVLSSDRDLPGFHVMPLTKGVKIRLGMAAFYHLEGDRIARASLYWMKPEPVT